ncbi:MAG: hypothetical protein MRZ43_08155 [Faecalimonas umbilicata]|uniref:hypothetical protein n=1 Tax=Faecalimonas umbilicata TaxID=1912855 RepID=UPI00242D1362|nr:hypothetical protein [Faecalimonas umbilicata]MCI5986318.1 hypothetical protein [Faecalimonas umbilicata]
MSNVAIFCAYELNELKYEAEKNGAIHPVADFSCEECGNYGVSMKEPLSFA